MRAVTAVMAVTAALLGAGCGAEDSGDARRPGGQANGTDLAFVTDMIPHHRGAIAMAELARRRGEHREIRALAAVIIRAQRDEIALLEAARQRFLDAGLEPEGMGMSHGEMGMDADVDDLKRAEPFDRAFIDAMIDHHRGAVAMARHELEKGGDPDALLLAEAIVEAQKREIADMRRWRLRWYGS